MMKPADNMKDSENTSGKKAPNPTRNKRVNDSFQGVRETPTAESQERTKAVQLRDRTPKRKKEEHEGNIAEARLPRMIIYMPGDDHQYPVEPRVIQVLPRRKHVANHSYRDFSCVPPDDDYVAKIEANLSDMTFSERVHFILSQEQYGDCMHWQPHGRSFMVSKPKQFEQRIAENFFAHKRYSSFLRQLTIYGFTAITRGADRNSFYHECMLRGLPHLCKYMPAAREVRQRLPDPDHEPNFYEISEAFPLPGHVPCFDISSVASLPRGEAESPDKSGRHSSTAMRVDICKEKEGTRRNEIQDRKTPSKKHKVSRDVTKDSSSEILQRPVLENSSTSVEMERSHPDSATVNSHLDTARFSDMQGPAVISALLGQVQEQLQQVTPSTIPSNLIAAPPTQPSAIHPFDLANRTSTLASTGSFRPQQQVPHASSLSSDENVAQVARVATELVHLLNRMHEGSR